MGIEVRPSGQVCGAAVRGVDLTRPLADATVGEIRAAWLEHRVLAFPDQELDDHDLERFTLAFGPFGDDPYIDAISDDHPHVIAVHRSADETASIFADTFHADWSFQEFPPDGTCLYGKIIPPVGGDTLYADQVAALAALPADLRERIEGRQAVHSARAGYGVDGLYGAGDAESERAMSIRSDESAHATRLHPVIRPHRETGVDSLYGCFGYMCGVEGMEQQEAIDLLLERHRGQTDERFVYRHTWEEGMLTMWDNRCILHKATGGYDGHERLLHRTTIGYNHDVPDVTAAA